MRKITLTSIAVVLLIGCDEDMSTKVTPYQLDDINKIWKIDTDKRVGLSYNESTIETDKNISAIYADFSSNDKGIIFICDDKGGFTRKDCIYSFDGTNVEMTFDSGEKETINLVKVSSKDGNKMKDHRYMRIDKNEFQELRDFNEVRCNASIVCNSPQLKGLMRIPTKSKWKDKTINGYYLGYYSSDQGCGYNDARVYRHYYDDGTFKQCQLHLSCGIEATYSNGSYQKEAYLDSDSLFLTFDSGLKQSECIEYDEDIYYITTNGDYEGSFYHTDNISVNIDI